MAGLRLPRTIAPSAIEGDVQITFPDNTVRTVDLKAAKKYIKHIAKTHRIYITKMFPFGDPDANGLASFQVTSSY